MQEKKADLGKNSKGIKWFDSHCHLDCEPLSEKLPRILSRAVDSGVKKILVPGILGPLARTDFPSFVLKAWGIHPGNCDRFPLREIESLFAGKTYRPAAIGECGLDVTFSIPLDLQKEIFAFQISLAKREKIPVLVHLRGAWDDALSLLKLHGSGIPWVFHAFSGSPEVARSFLNAGAFISFAGSLCYPNAKKGPRVAKMVPIDRILIETDSPDMRPPSFSGEHNEPAALPEVGKFLAAIKGISTQDLADQLYQNSETIFPKAGE